MLKNLLVSLGHEPNNIVVVDTGSQPPLKHEFLSWCHILEYSRDSERNIQKWWNAGLNYIKMMASARKQLRYDVAILNSDLELDKSALYRLQKTLTETNCNVAHPDHSGLLELGEYIIKKEKGTVPFQEKLTGYCFMIRQPYSVKFNEDLKWWYGEDDFEWKARSLGGVARVGCEKVTNLDPGGSEREIDGIARQTGLDGQLFYNIWGAWPSQ